MSLTVYKLIAAACIFFVSLLFVIYPLQKKAKSSLSESAELGEALASGIFFGAALFHMLPDAINSFKVIYPKVIYPYPELISAAGFLVLLFLERLSLKNSALATKTIMPLVLLVMLTVHALTEGAALGISLTFSEMTMLFIAISAHKGTETLALCITLIRHEIPIKQIIIAILFFALMTPLGIFLGTSIDLFAQTQNGALIAVIFNSFAAGTFLYISTLHHVHFHRHGRSVRALAEFSCLMLGVIAMSIIAIWT